MNCEKYPLNRLKELRINNKYSYREMAEMLNVSKSFYYQLENRKRTLSYVNAIKIANIFKLKPDDIFYNDIKNVLS